MDTIAAIATAPGIGGIGIIKISGPQAIQTALSIFRFKSKPNVLKEQIISHRMYLGDVHVPGKNHVIDEVLLVVMKAPHSYTGEDVVEIHAHGSQAVLNIILEFCLNQDDIRLAGPGEFTKRAFLNGRIELTKADAIANIISAQSMLDISMNASLMNGDFNAQIKTIRDQIISVIARLEVMIDFSEDIDDAPLFKDLAVQLNDLISEIEKLLHDYNNWHVIRNGVRIAIVGKPNVGKSSLLNRLLGKNRAIVTSLPGTTRDLIEETTIIQGISVVLSDTAGLHQTKDPVEKIGVQLSYDCLNTADIVLWVIDVSRTLTEEDHTFYNEINQKKIIIVLNKSDLISERHSPIPSQWCHPQVFISALHGTGIDTLKNNFVSMINNQEQYEAIPSIMPCMRHADVLRRTLKSLKNAYTGLCNQLFPELIIIDCLDGINSLDEILGSVYNDDILDCIFSDFCIGK